MRVENIKEPSQHIQAILDRVKHEYLHHTYQVTSWTDAGDFLTQLAQKTGKLLKVYGVAYKHWSGNAENAMLMYTPTKRELGSISNNLLHNACYLALALSLSLSLSLSLFISLH